MTRHAGATAAVLSAGGAAALWGTTGTARALGPDGADPVAVGALRILLGAAVLAVLAVSTLRRPTTRRARPGRLPLGVVMLLGGVCVAAYQAFFFVGVDRAGVAVGTVVALGTAPAATGVLGLLLGERASRRWVLGTATAVVGVALLVAGAGVADRSVDPPGVAASLGAGVSYAGYTVAARTLLLRGARGIVVMAAFFGVGAVLLVPVLPGADLSWLGTAPGALMVLWLGLVATGVAYVLFQRGLAVLPSGTVATLSLTEPVTATVLGVLVLHEHLSLLTAVGVAVVLLGLALTARRRSPRLAP
ncbi:hypothetical protein BJF81_11400 [Ornithinimicrobium sp. CNJ-824]|uniref:DMT family transporter n=1 Tax=Ornithinimicrobium sp. CNJ-824 TaxID=1904966 RepID=UPI000967DDBB|nr:EamA family transporter [Ornithinimicrobium sp. CNJ-824]OLT23287.1 hypothetical protein BJF81_11400 [Ornithinimicrobium sp. CNJ-824]